MCERQLFYFFFVCVRGCRRFRIIGSPCRTVSCLLPCVTFTQTAETRQNRAERYTDPGNATGPVATRIRDAQQGADVEREQSSVPIGLWRPGHPGVGEKLPNRVSRQASDAIRPHRWQRVHARLSVSVFGAAGVLGGIGECNTTIKMKTSNRHYVYSFVFWRARARTHKHTSDMRIRCPSNSRF